MSQNQLTAAQELAQREGGSLHKLRVPVGAHTDTASGALAFVKPSYHPTSVFGFTALEHQMKEFKRVEQKFLCFGQLWLELYLEVYLCSLKTLCQGPLLNQRSLFYVRNTTKLICKT
jgi:hypothetical protein